MRAALLGLLLGATLPSGPTAAGAPAGVHEHTVRSWTTADGLPQNSVNAIAQTRDGFLWLGTYGGLVRFDGVAFTLLDMASEPALASNRVTSLCVDAGGVLWVGTTAGVVCYVDGALRRCCEGPDAAASARIASIVRDGSGGVWIAGDGLFHHDDGGGEVIRAPTGREDDRIHALFRDGHGVLWIAGQEGAVRLRDGRWEELGARASCAAVPMRWVGPDPATDEPVFFGGAGIVRVEADGPRPYPWPPSATAARHPKLLLSAPYRDAHGDTWAGSNEDGLFRLAGAGAGGSLLPFALHPVAAELPVRRVTALFRDREDHLWVGTDGGGLHRLRPAEFRRWGADEGVLESVVSVALDDAGVPWLLDGMGRLVHVADGVVADAPDDLRPPDGIRAVAHGGGALWVASDEVLVRRGPDGATAAYAHGIAGPLLALHAAEDGAVWARTESALVRWRPDEPLASFDLPASARAAEAGESRLLEAARAGGVWLSQGTDLLRFDGAHFERIPLDVLRAATLRSLHEEADGTLWIGTYGEGLVRCRSGEAVRFTVADGLPDNSLGGILADGRGGLWFNSNRGVFRVSLANLEERARDARTRLDCRTLPTGEGNGAAGVAGADGRLWFPTIEGVVAVESAASAVRDVPPTARIDRLVAELSGDADVERPWRSGRPVELRRGARGVTIAFTGPSFADPRSVQFRYRLDGFDSGWTVAGPRRTATYTNLPPGEFRFRVNARRSDGRWSDEEARVLLRVPPPLHGTWWFRTLGGSAIGLLLIGTHRLRLRAVRERNAALELELGERGRIARDLQRREERYRAVADSAPEAIVTVEPSGAIVFANAAAEAVFGRDRAQLVGSSVAELVPAKARERYLRSFRELVQQSSTYGSVGGSARLQALRGDGSVVPVEVALGFERRPGGRQLYTAIVRDVGDRLLEEEERKRHHASVRESARREAIGRVAGGIAHDFNNVLTVLLGQAALLRTRLRGTTDPAVLEHLLELERSATRAGELTRQLLAYGGQQLRRPRAVDLARCVEQRADVLRRAVGGDVDLRVELRVPSVHVRADANQLEQLVLDLVLDARSAARAGRERAGADDGAGPASSRGRLTIAVDEVVLDADRAARLGLASSGRHALLHLTDTGEAHDDSDAELVFEPFADRGDGRDRSALGLASVHGIARLAGGSVTVARHAAEGTTVRVYLPALPRGGAPDDVLPAVAPLARRPEALAPRPDGGVPRAEREGAPGASAHGEPSSAF